MTDNISGFVVLDKSEKIIFGPTNIKAIAKKFRIPYHAAIECANGGHPIQISKKRIIDIRALDVIQHCEAMKAKGHIIATGFEKIKPASWLDEAKKSYNRKIKKLR